MSFFDFSSDLLVVTFLCLKLANFFTAVLFLLEHLATQMNQFFLCLFFGDLSGFVSLFGFTRDLLVAAFFLFQFASFGTAAVILLEHLATHGNQFLFCFFP